MPTLTVGGTLMATTNYKWTNLLMIILPYVVDALNNHTTTSSIELHPNAQGHD